MDVAEAALKLVDQVSAPADKMTKAIKRVGDEAHKAQAHVGKLDEFGEALGQFGGEPGEKIEGLFGKLQKLGPMLENPYVVGAVAVAAYVGALGLVTEKIGDLLVEGMKLSLEAAEEEARFKAMFSAMTGSAKGGDEVVEMLDNLRNVTGMTKAAMAPFAEQLLGMGVQTEYLAGHLRALAVAEKLGMGGAEVYTQTLSKLTQGLPLSTKQLKDLYKTGANVDEILKKFGVKTLEELSQKLKDGSISANAFGTAVEESILAKESKLGALGKSSSATMALMKERFEDLFEDVNITPFTEAFSKAASVLDKNKATGHALNVIITSLFNKMFQGAGKAIPWLVIQFKKMIIVVLEVLIWLKKFQFWLKNSSDGMMVAKVAVMVLAVAFGLLAIVVGVILLAALILVLIPFVLIGVALAVVTAVVIAAYVQIMVLYDWVMKIASAFDTWKQSATNAAASLIVGLVKGIKDGIATVTGAVDELGKATTDSLRKKLGIASPSKEFQKLGMYAGQGFAEGIAAATDDAAGASGGLGSNAMAGAPGGGGGGGGGLTVNVMPGAFPITAAASAQQVEEVLEEKVVLIFERVAQSQGLG